MGFIRLHAHLCPEDLPGVSLGGFTPTPTTVVGLWSCHDAMTQERLSKYLTTKSDALGNPDGGGIRGLSSLLMLREILYRIRQERQLPDLPRPCDFFDLAGGTSTGGCVAVTPISIFLRLIDLDWQAYRDNALPATNVN